ncbi:zinc ribbon domain-containing protein [Gehongia tenuis]|uniref:C4-type zinc ribbon domain-containing protein n=1 Tax=Gehongia tenuis TaxID=2763655 RepID=A0A926D5U5_9FIRM|nr:C4-type zinc ribbon domain-containing protein [Gehongia tenuis]MBC8530925.1 hypothetical protein [Gehongia tenuis]
MQNLDMLLEYQNLDLQLDQLEKKLRQDPTRLKLLKVRNFFNEKQKQLQNMDQSAEQQQKLFLTLQKEIKLATEQLLDLKEEQQDEELDLHGLQDLRKRTESLLDVLVKREKELKSIVDAWSTVESRLRRMNAQIVAAKRDYAELKKEYDDIFKNYQKQMAPYQAKKKDMEGDLDPELLKRYKRIRSARPNPVAPIVNNQCSGCNMELPSAMLMMMREAPRPMECENCGRILFLKES